MEPAPDLIATATTDSLWGDVIERAAAWVEWVEPRLDTMSRDEAAVLLANALADMYRVRDSVSIMRVRPGSTSLRPFADVLRRLHVIAGHRLEGPRYITTIRPAVGIDSRIHDILEYRDIGLSHEAIGTLVGISQTRVSQILRKNFSPTLSRMGS